MSRPKMTRKHRSAAGRGGKKPPATKPKFKEVEFEEVAAVKVKIVDDGPDSADSKKRSKRNRDEDGKEKSEEEKEKEKAEEEERERERARAKKNEEELLEEERKRQEEILKQVAEDEKRREEELLKKLNDEEKKIRDDALAYFEEQYKTLGFDERKATSYMILLAQGALINKYDLRKGKKEQKKMFATSNGQLFFTDPKKGKPDPRDSIQLYRVREVQKGRVGAPFQKTAKKAADNNCLVIVGSEADAFLEMTDEDARNLWVEALLYVKHVGPEAGR